MDVGFPGRSFCICNTWDSECMAVWTAAPPTARPVGGPWTAWGRLADATRPQVRQLPTLRCICASARGQP